MLKRTSIHQIEISDLTRIKRHSACHCSCPIKKWTIAKRETGRKYATDFDDSSLVHFSGFASCLDLRIPFAFHLVSS